MIISRKIIQEAILTQGYIIIEGVLQKDAVDYIKLELENAIVDEAKYHKTDVYQDYGMVMLCSLYGKAFIELFDNRELMYPIDTILGDGCITYAYTSSSMPPNSTNYSGDIHVDCPRLIENYLTNFSCIIALDDFTENNGATWLLPGSQIIKERPRVQHFYQNAKRFIANAGTVLYFNPRLWHAGGCNKTQKWRHALTLNMCRPYMKQRIDIPRAMQHIDMNVFSENAKQKLGFLAQPPSSYNEYYVVKEKRKFRQIYE